MPLSILAGAWRQAGLFSKSRLLKKQAAQKVSLRFRATLPKSRLAKKQAGQKAWLRFRATLPKSTLAEKHTQWRRWQKASLTFFATESALAMVELAFSFALKILIVVREHSRLSHDLAGGWREVDYLKSVCASFLKRVVPTSGHDGDLVAQPAISPESNIAFVPVASAMRVCFELLPLAQYDSEVNVNFSLGELANYPVGAGIPECVLETMPWCVVTTHSISKLHVPMINSWPGFRPDWRERACAPQVSSEKIRPGVANPHHRLKVEDVEVVIPPRFEVGKGEMRKVGG